MSLLGDFRHALNRLKRQAGITGLAVVMLATGIGSTTAIYSVIHRLILEPLPFPGGERMVHLWKTHETLGFWVVPSKEEIEAFARAPGVEAVDYYETSQVSIISGGEPLLTRVCRVRPQFFSFFNTAPVLGRPLVASDVEPGGAPVAILSYSLWQNRFGGDPGVLASDVELDDRPHRVIGVMPPYFDYPSNEIRAWVPLIFDPGSPPVGFNNVARLAPGVTPDQVSAQLTGILSGLHAGQGGPQWSPVVRLPGDTLSIREKVLWILLAVVGLVLLIACANVANLLLVRGTRFHNQMAVRSALGAARGRLVREVLAESLMVALSGGLLGILMVYWGLDLVKAFRPENLAELNSVRVSPEVLLFSLTLSLLTGLLAGLLPAFRLSRPEIVQALRGAITHSASTRTTVARRVLVVGEVAICTVLLIGAGLLAKSFLSLLSMDPGYRPEGLVVVRVDLPETRYPAYESRQAFLTETRDRLATLPAIEAVTVAMGIPPMGGIMGGAVDIEGREVDSSPTVFTVNYVAPEYFRITGIPLLSGRPFLPEENFAKSNAIIINEQLADSFWKDRSPVGDRVRFGPDQEWETIVGVVPNVRAFGLRDSGTRMRVYMPIAALDLDEASFVARTTGDEESVLRQMKEVIWSGDSKVPIPIAGAARQLLVDSVDSDRFSLALFALFSGIGLVLSTLGLYGIVSFWVASRSREIGIRIALGAERMTILAMVLRSGAVTALLGVGLGLALAYWLTQTLSSLLVEVSPRDPAIFLFVPIVLVAVTLLAALVPARRATRIDPIEALRTE